MRLIDFFLQSKPLYKKTKLKLKKNSKQFMVRFMKTKKIFYRSIQALRVIIAASLLLMCIVLGYIFFCNLAKMDAPTLGNFQIRAATSDSTNPAISKGDAIIINTKTGEYLFKILRFGGFLTTIKEKPYVMILPPAAMILVLLLLSQMGARLKTVKNNANDAKTNRKEDPMNEQNNIENMPIIEPAENSEESENWQKDAQTVLQQIIGDAKLELNQMKQDAQAESEKIIAEAKAEAKQIREDAKGEISMMKVYAEKMLEEASSKLEAAKEKAQKIIEDAQAKASEMIMSGQKERELANEDIKQLIAKLQDIVEPVSPFKKAVENSPSEQTAENEEEANSAAESGVCELAILRA